MLACVFSRVIIIVFGSLYPAYASFKAVRAKNVQDYVKWMMYWIVFAICSCIEAFTDAFLFWVPFYYEIKVLLVFWLLSPLTNGSSILYRNFVHPLLQHKENKIDNYIVHMRQQSYATFMQLARKTLHQFSVFIGDIVHLNFRAMFQQSTINPHVNKSGPKIIITSINGTNLKEDDNHLSAELESGVASNENGKISKKTRNGGKIKLSNAVASKRKGKTNAVEKEK